MPRDLTYLVGVSADGFIAGPGGEVDAFPVTDDVIAHLVADFPETLPAHVRAALGVTDPPRRWDTVVQGRATYEPAVRAGLPSPYSHLRQIVASRTLPPPVPEVEVTADPLATVRRLKQEDGLGIYLAGGGALAGALLDEIDELVLKQYPVLLGRGIPLFGDRAGTPPRPLELVASTTLARGTVVSTYRIDALGVFEGLYEPGSLDRLRSEERP